MARVAHILSVCLSRFSFSAVKSHITPPPRSPLNLKWAFKMRWWQLTLMGLGKSSTKLMASTKTKMKLGVLAQEHFLIRTNYSPLQAFVSEPFATNALLYSCRLASHCHLVC